MGTLSLASDAAVLYFTVSDLYKYTDINSEDIAGFSCSNQPSDMS